MDFSRRLKKAMEDRGITVRALSERLDVGEASIYRWRRGNGGSLPRHDVYPRLARELGVTVDWLFTGKGKAPRRRGAA